jgi:alpha-beta hydrolase superfamily lysophospholipase
MPTLIVWGDRDRIIPVGHARAAHEAMPGSRIAIIDEAGHFAHVEEPSRFVEILCEFMETTKPSRVTPEERRQLLLAPVPPAQVSSG